MIYLTEISSTQDAAFELLLVLNELVAQAEAGEHQATVEELRWCRDAARMCYQYQTKPQVPSQQ